ncbi:hypothetical protein Tco_1104740 [Tanacetum coccineum]
MAWKFPSYITGILPGAFAEAKGHIAGSKSSVWASKCVFSPVIKWVDGRMTTGFINWIIEVGRLVMSVRKHPVLLYYIHLGFNFHHRGRWIDTLGIVSRFPRFDLVPTILMLAWLLLGHGRENHRVADLVCQSGGPVTGNYPWLKFAARFVRRYFLMLSRKLLLSEAGNQLHMMCTTAGNTTLRSIAFIRDAGAGTRDVSLSRK